MITGNRKYSGAFKHIFFVLECAGCWNHWHNPEKSKNIKIVSLFWSGFLFLSFVNYTARTTISSLRIDHGSLAVVYLISYAIHGTLNFVTLLISCLRNDGLGIILTNFKLEEKNIKQAKMFNVLVFSFMLAFVVGVSFAFLIFPFLSSSRDVMKTSFYFYVSSYEAFCAIIIYDTITFFFLSLCWLGLPALQACIGYSFTLEFKTLHNSLTKDIGNGRFYSSDTAVSDFINKYSNLANMFGKIDNILSYMTGIGIGTQIPFLCLIFYHRLLSSCPSDTLTPFFIASILLLANMTVLPAVMESQVSTETCFTHETHGFSDQESPRYVFLNEIFYFFFLTFEGKVSLWNTVQCANGKAFKESLVSGLKFSSHDSVKLRLKKKPRKITPAQSQPNQSLECRYSCRYFCTLFRDLLWASLQLEYLWCPKRAFSQWVRILSFSKKIQAFLWRSYSDVLIGKVFVLISLGRSPWNSRVRKFYGCPLLFKADDFNQFFLLMLVILCSCLWFSLISFFYLCCLWKRREVAGVFFSKRFQEWWDLC